MPNHLRGDYSQISFKHEAPTYGTASGNAIWPNQVLDFDPEETENIIETVYAGGGDRNVDQYNNGPIDARFTIPFNVQNGQHLWQAFGKETISSGTTSTHTIVEMSGTLPSETFEVFMGAGVANGNLKRTFGGCTANSLALSCAVGELLKGEVEWIAGSATAATSGAVTAVTAASTTPYRWDHTQLLISGGGIDGTLRELKEVNFTLNNNLDDATHYLNLARTRGQPIPQGRRYNFDFTMNTTAGSASSYHDKFFRGGSTANFDLFFFRTSGTDHLQLWMSGCRADPLSTPFRVEGTEEQLLTFRPQTCGIIIKDAVGDAYSA